MLVLLVGFIAGLSGTSWICVLSREDIMSTFTNYGFESYLYNSQLTTIQAKIKTKILYVLFMCEKCLSGQIALWYGLYKGLKIEVVLSILIAIIFSVIVTKIIKYDR